MLSLYIAVDSNIIVIAQSNAVSYCDSFCAVVTISIGNKYLGADKFCYSSSLRVGLAGTFQQDQRLLQCTILVIKVTTL